MIRPLPPQRQKVMEYLAAGFCLLLLSCCHSQSTEEEISVAIHCDDQHLHVAIGEGMFGLERAQCVPVSEGVPPSEFIAEFRGLVAK